MIMIAEKADSSGITLKQNRLIRFLRSKHGSLQDDEPWRNHVETVTGKRHVSGLSSRQAGQLIDNLKTGKMPARRTKRTAAGNMATTAQIERAEHLWTDLVSAGKVSDPDGLNAYVLKRAKVERMEWLTAKQAQSLIEQLKKWLNR